MFSPIRTERLVLRPVRIADADALHERRNDPEVAELQSWTLPFPLERAVEIVTDGAARSEPPIDEWWMLAVCDLDDTTIYGDMALRLENDGRSAEVGYSFDRIAWGNGYAVEALTGLVDWLFDVQGVTRAMGMLHPDNARSARVLESCGFVFEGHLRNSYWVGDVNSDDWIYGLTPEQRDAWNNRPRGAPETIELVELYPIGLRDVMALETHHSQRGFVAPIAESMAQVAVPPPARDDAGNPTDSFVEPWPRVIHADGEPVGFVMLAKPTEASPEPYLWRLLIDRLHQRRGIGRRVIELVVDEVKVWGCESLRVSWVPGVGSPEPLYLGMGFEPTGKVHDVEIEGRLSFGDSVVTTD